MAKTKKQEALQEYRLFQNRKEILEKLHQRWFPHKGQILPGKALFGTENPKKDIFLQCGRNWGKSQFITYAAVRWALLNPGSHIYIIGPEAKQEREIIWASKLLHSMIPVEYLWKQDPDKAYNKQEARAQLANDSFVKVDGADNEEALRGIKPHLVLGDEFKDWKKEASENMDPNLAAKNAPIVRVGTPPDRECHYTEKRRFVMDMISQGQEDYFYLELPTETNPHISKDWLARKEAELIKRGEEAIWRREYMAEYIPGGANAVFPAFSRNRVKKSRDLIHSLIERDKRKLQWFVLSDPASSSVFANLFLAYNQYTKQVWVVDEIYERDRALTTTTKMFPRIQKVQFDHYPNLERWSHLVDNHEVWFILQVSESFGFSGLIPTAKEFGSKDNHISTIKDMIAANLLVVSDECEWFLWEMENYVTNEKGDLPKKDDHLIDCLRYFVAYVNYSTPESPGEQFELEDSSRGESYQDWLGRNDPDALYFDGNTIVDYDI